MNNAIGEPQGIEESLVTLLCYKSSKMSDTRLTKLLYLVDLYHAEIYGHPLTEVKFKRYFYGPWASDISRIKEVLMSKGILREKRSKTQEGNTATVPKPALNQVSVYLSPEAMEVADAVLNDWGNKSTNDIVAYVKTRPPFVMTSFDEEIDFAKADPIAALARKWEQSPGETATDIIARTPHLKDLVAKAMRQEEERKFADPSEASALGLPI